MHFSHFEVACNYVYSLEPAESEEVADLSEQDEQHPDRCYNLKASHRKCSCREFVSMQCEFFFKEVFLEILTE